jgi:hypothetical protein
MIPFACPNCRAVYQFPFHLAGKKFACSSCKTPLSVPFPQAEPVEQLDQLEEVPEPPVERLDQLEEVPELPVEELEEVPAVLPVADAWPPVPEPAKKKRGLVVHGTNGSVELVERELIFYLDGSGVRRRTYRRDVLGLTEIDLYPPSILGEGSIVFTFGGRLDPDVREGLDTITIDYPSGENAEFVHFKKEVERFRKLLIDHIGMHK